MKPITIPVAELVLVTVGVMEPILRESRLTARQLIAIAQHQLVMRPDRVPAAGAGKGWRPCHDQQ